MRRKIKGVILAGGLGTRLMPLTSHTNKHLLPCGSEPMVYHAIRRLEEAGIRHIIIITGPEYAGAMFQGLGDGSQFGVELTFRIQSKPGGIAEALLLCETFIGNDKSVVILGDNIFDFNEAGRFHQIVQDFEEYPWSGAKILLKEVENPERFGVATLNGDRIETIVEKPENPKSNLAVTGIYLYDNNVFKAIRQCEPSKRGELEITDVHNIYLKEGVLKYDYLDGFWSDAGTLESYQFVNDYLRNNNGSLYFGRTTEDNKSSGKNRSKYKTTKASNKTWRSPSS